jgi:phosphate transport system substrate-binding protein
MRFLFLKMLLTVTALFGVVASGAPARADEVNGSGSTFIYPIMSRWADAYAAQGGHKVTYQPIGSSGGIVQIKSGMVDFGASDMPLTSTELDQAQLAQFPAIIGGVAAVVNVAGVKPGQLHFTGPLLADIFLGKITNWSAPGIKAVNPGVTLPDAEITVVHRKDGSGTTFNWVDYLSKVSPEWKAKVGRGTLVSWPTGIGAKGNEGVADTVTRTRNSIAYVEYTYALQNKMSYAAIQNRAGKFIEPSATAFQAAATDVEWQSAKNFCSVITDAPGDAAYPVAATTFILMRKSPTNPARADAALNFFGWALSKGQKEAESLAYVPLPDRLVQQIEDYWHFEIK